MADTPPEYPGTPRWVKVFGSIVFIVVVGFFILLLGGGHRHGPGRHMPSAGAEDRTRHSGAPEGATSKGSHR